METIFYHRAMLDALRRGGGPMTVKAIADAIMTERGLNQADRALGRTMHKRVSMALRYQRTNGMVEEARDGRSSPGDDSHAKSF